MKEILEKACKGDESSLELMIRLVDHIRPGRFKKKAFAVSQVQNLIALLKSYPELKEGLRNCILDLLNSRAHMDLLAESGILSNEGFFTETFRKISYKIFPPVLDDHELKDVIIRIFHRESDHEWVYAVPDSLWAELFEEIEFGDPSADRKEEEIENSLLDSVLFVSHRIAAMGIEPVLTNQMPELEQNSSPFISQNKKIVAFTDKVREEGIAAEDVNRDWLRIHAELMICEDVLHTLRKQRYVNGTSLSLTYLLIRLHQSIDRIKILFGLLLPEEKSERRNQRIISFFKATVRQENLRNDLGKHLSENLGMLAYQITEHAGKTGEHYITSSRREYITMLYSAMKGGFIVGFLSAIKTLIYYLKLSPFGTAFLYSMNYSFGFITVLLIRGTIATKQPAMTAAHIAASLDSKERDKADIPGLSELIVKVSRSQLIAFVGNVFVAFPIAYILAWIYYFVFGEHLAGPEKAHHMIDELHPWKSLALFHAGIAGVCLFLSGLISGYYDNGVIFNKIPQRVKEHPLLRRIMPARALDKLSRYLEHNMGSLAGNFFLGIFLGSIGTLGAFFGLPLDIRHISFVSGNFGLAMAGLEHQLSWQVILISIAGIVGIGIMNFAVSFGLALFVAIRSRNIDFRQTRALMHELWLHARSKPLDFIRPPRNARALEPEMTEETL
ncbi:MAG: site-specific recombinase [Bacteroidia bacterium]|nr:site-specific recombinase [Bacteroidia bacterium]